jgi:hypothetical protein
MQRRQNQAHVFCHNIYMYLLSGYLETYSFLAYFASKIETITLFL